MLAKTSNVSVTLVAGFIPNDGSKITKKFEYCTAKKYRVIHNFQASKQFEFFWDSFETFSRYGYEC
jgi:hypothetical protein